MPIFRIVNEASLRQVLIGCAVETAGQFYTKYAMFFSFASATVMDHWNLQCQEFT
jgi:hypothetical protein